MSSIKKTFRGQQPPVHGPKSVKDLKLEENVQEYTWPLHSRDLFPIQDVWAYEKRKLQGMILDSENLENAVVAIRNKFPIKFLQNLYPSMANRVNQWLKN